MLGVDGGVSLSDPVHFPSSRRLHKWGGEHLGALAAPPLYPRPRAFEGPRTQRSISLVFPLCSQPDEVISPPSVWPRAVPNSRVLKYLGGAADDSPRLGPYDRTATQPAQDIERGTSYKFGLLPPRRHAHDDAATAGEARVGAPGSNCRPQDGSAPPLERSR